MGKGAYDRDLELMDAWSTFCDQVRRAGEQVFKDANGATEVERVSGFRYLTQNLGQAFDMWLENRDTTHPFAHPFCSPIRKLGADNADCIYNQSWINDRDTYRISGTPGTARMFNIGLQGEWTGTMHDPFGDLPLDNVFVHDLELDGQGRFELWIGPEPHDGNWMAAPPGSRKLFYRQYFESWDQEPASFRIECVTATEPPAPLTTDSLVDAFERAGRFVFEAVDDWPDTTWDMYGIAEETNRFVPQRVDGSDGPDAAWSEESDAKRGRLIISMSWHLELDEAMVIEFEPEDMFWMITNLNVFGASMDYRYRQVNLTSGTAAQDADGRTRLVMSHTDPGFANWIDTEGHEHGWLMFRNVSTRAVPELRTRVVKASDLEDELGEGAPQVSDEQRRASLRTRTAAYARRFPTLGV